jgi:Flp pilus assembly protein TadG
MIAERRRHPSGTGTGPPPRRALHGQAIIELAIVGLALLTMTFGVIEIGRAFYASTAVTNAARDGARVAMNPAKSNAEIVAAAEAAAGDVELSSVTMSRSTTIGEMSTVTATYEFNSFVPLISELWGGGPLIISESATSRVGWD